MLKANHYLSGGDEPRDGVFVILETQRFDASADRGGNSICIGQRKKASVLGRTVNGSRHVQVLKSLDAYGESVWMEMQFSAQAR